MNFRHLALTNYLTFLILTIALTSLQCSLWLQFFGYFPSPYMWIPTLVYWALYRRIHEGLLMCYMLVITTVSLSSIPISLFLFLNLIFYALAILIKQRIYWNGPTYLMLISGITSMTLTFFHFILSWILETKPIVDPEILDGILSGLFTSLVSLPLYYIFAKIDHVTNKELPTEAGTGKYE